SAGGDSGSGVGQLFQHDAAERQFVGHGLPPAGPAEGRGSGCGLSSGGREFLFHDAHATALGTEFYFGGFRRRGSGARKGGTAERGSGSKGSGYRSSRRSCGGFRERGE